MHRFVKAVVVTASLALASAAFIGATPSPTGPLDYTIHVDPHKLNEYRVTLRTTAAAGPLVLVMARHPEYDDRFWRFVTDLHATSAGRALNIVREDSARWRVDAPNGDLVLEYRIVMPAPQPGIKPSWRPYVAANAALVGAAHSYIYPAARTTAPIRVHMDVPAQWRVATGLTRNADARDFTARDIFNLVDSPILTGELKIWTFEVNGVPHRIAYAPLPEATPFDTSAFVSLVRGMAKTTIDMFRDMPYRDYTFLFRDDAYGGLEHANSVNMGAPSATLARDLTEDATDFEHEFFHTWNLVAFHPVGRGGAREGEWPLSRGLWLSEGGTMYYTDVVLRRAGFDTTPRIRRLEGQIGNYYSNPGNTHVAPETTSMYSDELPGGTGDYSPDLHLQGQMISTVLDLMIRDSTGWKRSLDDVMRDLYARRTAAGFTSADVVASVSRACGCNAAPFFTRHVASATPLDFAPALRTLGLQISIRTDTARNTSGEIEPDLGLWAYNRPGHDELLLIIRDPADSWGRAGLHTGDELISWDGKQLKNFAEFRSALRATRTGATAALGIRSHGADRIVQVHVGPAIRTNAVITSIPNATSAQLAHRAAWEAAKE